MNEAIAMRSANDDEVAYRRVPSLGTVSMVVFDEALHEMRPSSGAFAWDDDGCSVHLRSMLFGLGLGLSDLLYEPVNCVFSVTAPAIRSCQLDLVEHPWPQYGGPSHPRDGAHGLIVNPAPLSRRGRHKALQALARAAQWCVSPPGGLEAAVEARSHLSRG